MPEPEPEPLTPEPTPASRWWTLKVPIPLPWRFLSPSVRPIVLAAVVVASPFYADLAARHGVLPSGGCAAPVPPDPIDPPDPHDPPHHVDPPDPDGPPVPPDPGPPQPPRPRPPGPPPVPPVPPKPFIVPPAAGTPERLGWDYGVAMGTAIPAYLEGAASGSWTTTAGLVAVLNASLDTQLRQAAAPIVAELVRRYGQAGPAPLSPAARADLAAFLKAVADGSRLVVEARR